MSLQFKTAVVMWASGSGSMSLMWIMSNLFGYRRKKSALKTHWAFRTSDTPKNPNTLKTNQLFWTASWLLHGLESLWDVNGKFTDPLVVFGGCIEVISHQVPDGGWNIPSYCLESLKRPLSPRRSKKSSWALKTPTLSATLKICPAVTVLAHEGDTHAGESRHPALVSEMHRRRFLLLSPRSLHRLLQLPSLLPFWFGFWF